MVHCARGNNALALYARENPARAGASVPIMEEPNGGGIAAVLDDVPLAVLKF